MITVLSCMSVNMQLYVCAYKSLNKVGTHKHFMSEGQVTAGYIKLLAIMIIVIYISIECFSFAHLFSYYCTQLHAPLA